MRNRSTFFALLATVLLLIVGIIGWMSTGPQRSARMNVLEQNATDPMAAEMACIDAVLQDNGLRAEQIEARMGACRSGGAGRKQ